MFGDVMGKLVSEYQQLGSNLKTRDLVIFHSEYWIDTPGANWLALNPVVGARLGWSIADDGLFRWLDDEGRVTAESIWWTDGHNKVFADGLPDDEVGEGWMVLASKRAMEQIQEVFGPLSRKSAAVRRYEKGTESSEWTAVSGTP